MTAKARRLILPLLTPLVCIGAGLIRFTEREAWAATTYRLQAIARAGDSAGAARIKPNSPFFIGGLNDHGQVVFVADNAAGGQMLVQHSDGRLIPIVAAGGEAPGGTWSKRVVIRSPVSLNQAGNAAFAAEVTVAGKDQVGTFLWEAGKQRVTPVALKGMAAIQNLTFEVAGGMVPTINHRDEVAVVAATRNAAGQVRDGVFLWSRDGSLRSVLRPDEVVAGEQVLAARAPSLSDAGAVTMLAKVRGQALDRLCRWEQGSPALLPPVDRRDLGTSHLLAIGGVWANSANRNLLIAAHNHSLSSASDALYLLADGKYTPVAVPGQTMPGGGRFRSVQYLDPLAHTQLRPDGLLTTGVSAANAAGQHAFLAVLEGGATAAYLMEPDGSLSLILKSGTTTDLGKVGSIGQGAVRSQGIALNNQGQIALPARFANAPESVVLLSPVTAP